MRTRATAKRRTSPATSRAPVKNAPAKKTGSADRLRALARRCRVVAEDTAMPEISQELTHIAEALEDEADTLAGR
jgi:hypothetical protein